MRAPSAPGIAHDAQMEPIVMTVPIIANYVRLEHFLPLGMKLGIALLVRQENSAMNDRENVRTALLVWLASAQQTVHVVMLGRKAMSIVRFV